MKKAAVLLLLATAAYASAPATAEEGGKILHLPEGPHHSIEVPGPPRQSGGTWLIDMFFHFAK